MPFPFDLDAVDQAHGDIEQGHGEEPVEHKGEETAEDVLVGVFKVLRQGFMVDFRAREIVV